MISLKSRPALRVLCFVTVTSASWAADASRSTTDQTKAATPSTSRSTSSRSTSAKGPLPDPALLDGSTQPAEKKSEHGMIGEFELPGDENVRNGKVGGPQAAGQQGQQAQGASGAMGLPQGGGGQQGQQGGGQPPPSAQQGGGQNQNAGGNPVAGGDPNAKAQGTQVSQLGGEGGSNPADAAAEKPASVAIGDSAMQIKAAAPPPGVVGGQQPIQGNTQHHEKGTGTGGKQPTGVQGNNRVEKGRTIPAGL